MAAMALCIALVVMGSALYAAPAQSTRKASDDPETIYDPFELKRVAVSMSDPQLTITVKPAGSATFVAPDERLCIRIPPQLPFRSAFHPLHR